MGVSGKPQVDGGLESEGKKWVIAGISLRPPLKPICTNPVDKKETSITDKDEDEADEFSTTPTGEESRIPTVLTCPPAPRKRKPSLKCNYENVKEFFMTPPDLETVFIRHFERTN